VGLDVGGLVGGGWLRAQVFGFGVVSTWNRRRYCDKHGLKFLTPKPETHNPYPRPRITEGINTDVSLEKGNSSVTRNSSGFGGIFTAPGPYFTLLPEDLFPAMVEDSSDGDAGGDGEGEGVDSEGERSREVWNVDAVIRKLPPSYLVPKVGPQDRDHES
jgi:hypothetical protein